MSKTCTTCNTTYPDEMVFCPSDGTSLRLDDAQGDLIGMVIAERYKVNKLLGEGGMGKVYQAQHVRLPQQAAIKVLHQDMVKDAGAVARFNREAANAARIEHDRVARVFDFGETSDGLVYIAMEFVPGITLRGLLDEERRLTPVRAANLVYQVAEGLDAAHRLNIVHRDLKPDNILVITDEVGVDRCKVVDFGIAKVTNGSETQLTQVGMLVGTPDYMSPEQVLGEQLDGRSDLYALALVAFEMFTGDLPFEGSTPERKLTARLIQDPRTLADVAPDVAWPPALLAAFDHALVREPENRTASAMEFADALVNAVEAWTGMSVLRARTPMSTPAILSAAGESTNAMARPTPVSTAAVSSRKSAPTPPPSSPRSPTPGASTSASKVAIPEPAPKKSPVAAIAAAVVVIAAVGGYFAFSRGSADAGVTPAAATSDVAGGAPTTPAGAPSAVGNGTQAPAPNAASGGQPAGTSLQSATTGAGTSGAGSTGSPTTNPGAAGSAVPNAPASTSNAANAADAAVAQKELSAIRAGLESIPDGQETVVGARAVRSLILLMPRLGNATDSTWALNALAMAYLAVEEPAKACQPLRDAARIATSARQKEAVELLRNNLTCAP